MALAGLEPRFRSLPLCTVPRGALCSIKPTMALASGSLIYFDKAARIRTIALGANQTRFMRSPSHSRHGAASRASKTSINSRRQAASRSIARTASGCMSLTGVAVCDR